MPLSNYGVLKGKVIGNQPFADDDHYQILVQAGKEKWRLAVNVLSQIAPAQLLYETRTDIPADLKTALSKLKVGFKALKSKPGDLAQDFVRSGLVDKSAMIILPPDKAGPDNDLRDEIDKAVGLSIADPDSSVYAFGVKWGPEKKKDEYFHFKPGQGVHDIHMNQGNSGKFVRDDGVFQDGCLMFEHSGGKWQAIFLAFQSQSFDTDDKTGHTKPGAAPAPAKKVAKKKKN